MLRSRYCFCVLCVTLGAALALALYLLAPRPAAAADPAPAAKGPVSFINDVAPILKENCMGCHGAKNPKGKLDMTKFAIRFCADGRNEGHALPRRQARREPHRRSAPRHGHPHAAQGRLRPPAGRTRSPSSNSGSRKSMGQARRRPRRIKPGCPHKELRTRWQPPQPPITYAFPVTITSLAFTPDGKQLVASGHHELTVWDAATGKLVKRIRTRARRALAMVFLPDGGRGGVTPPLLAVAGGRPGEEGDVRVYDINGGTPKTIDGVAYLDGVEDKGVMLKQLLDADDEVLCLALSPDGKKLASGGCDRIVIVWDLFRRGMPRPSSSSRREPRRLGLRRRLRGRRQVRRHRQPRQDGQGVGPGQKGIGGDLPGPSEQRLRRGHQRRRQDRHLGRRRQPGAGVERPGRPGRQADPRHGRPQQDHHQDGGSAEAAAAGDGQRRRHGADLE